MKRFRKRGTIAFKRRSGWPRHKKRPVWEGVGLLSSKKAGKVVLREEYHCSRYKKCGTAVCRVIVPLNKPPKKCIKEGTDGKV